MSIFPGAIPPASAAVTTDTLAAAGHTALHNNDRDEIRALASKLGTGSSTPAAGQVLRSTGAATSLWGAVSLTTDVTGVLPQGSGGTGTTSASGTGAAVYQSSPTISTPTITTPTISDFTNSNHDHSNAAGGGNLGTVTATSLTTNTISANGANHVSLSAGPNKLVKTTLLRQDNTTNTYQMGNSVMLTGWGVIVPGVTDTATEAVTFGVTFAQPPILTMTAGGDHASSATYGSGGNNVQGRIDGKAYGITTTGFTAYMIAAGNWAAGNTVFYQWVAIGEL